jgi:rhomboid protease GluP
MYGMDTKKMDEIVVGTPWLPVMIDTGTPHGKRKVHTWALVLDSRSIPCCIENDGANWLLLVPEPHLVSARNELLLYEENNRNWPPPLPAARKLFQNMLPSLSILILLATFHNLRLLGLSLPDYGIIDFGAIGTAHAEKILNGEWWRLITSLMLHADLTHLLSNLTIGGVFIILLCSELGSGLAWSLLLASGVAGNLLNAWLQSPTHRSVGASTAVFGAVGLLAAISMVRHRYRLQRRWFIPVAAGMALLAVLGTEGKNTDLGAHLFGFGSGVIFGAIVEYIVGRFGKPGRRLNSALAIVTAVMAVAAWWFALKAP